MEHDEYNNGGIAFAFVIEPFGARELAPILRPDGFDRLLQFTDEAEPVLWAADPESRSVGQ